mgnify:FL=1
MLVIDDLLTLNFKLVHRLLGGSRLKVSTVEDFLESQTSIASSAGLGAVSLVGRIG